MARALRIVTSDPGNELRFGSVAAVHGARVAPMIVGRTAAGITVGIIAGTLAFALPYSWGAYSPGGGVAAGAVWLLLPVFAFLGAAAFGYAGFRLGTVRAGTYLLIDTGYLEGLLGSLVDRVSERMKGSPLAVAVDSSVQEAICNDDDLRADDTMAGGFVARLKARVYRLVLEQLGDRFPRQDMNAGAKALLVDKIVENVRDDLEASSTQTARLIAIATLTLFVAVPSLFLALG